MNKTVILTQEILDECKSKKWAIEIQQTSPSFPRIRWDEEQSVWLATAQTNDSKILGKVAKIIR